MPPDDQQNPIGQQPNTEDLATVTNQLRDSLEVIKQQNERITQNEEELKKAVKTINDLQTSCDALNKQHGPKAGANKDDKKGTGAGTGTGTGKKDDTDLDKYKNHAVYQALKDEPALQIYFLEFLKAWDARDARKAREKYDSTISGKATLPTDGATHMIEPDESAKAGGGAPADPSASSNSPSSSNSNTPGS